MRSKRAGFTLIEMMVAMALTLFVMVILSQAFVLSLETFARMKGIGDMQINLRVATTLLRDDLGQDHFEGKRRLSDPLIATAPPLAGHFTVLQRSAITAATGYHSEGSDSNGMPSFRATDHVLYMTVKRKGNRRENFFTAPLPNPNVIGPFFASQTAYDVPIGNYTDATLSLGWTNPMPTGYYASQWAEVVYYLKRQGSTEEQYNAASGLGTPTYELYRAEFVMVPDNTPIKGQNFYTTAVAGVTVPVLTGWRDASFKPMSCDVIPSGGNSILNFYTPAEAAQGMRVIPSLANFDPQAAVGSVTTTRVLLSETAVLPNVLSFQIQVQPAPAPGGGFLPFQDVPSTGTSGQLYDTTLFNPNVPATTYNNRFPLKAIQITMRVWDPGTRQTRQVTVLQDL